MKLFFFSLLLITGANLFAQANCDYNKKTSAYICEGTEQFKFEITKSANFAGFKDIYLLDNAGKRVVFFQFNQFADNQTATGENQYYEVMFLAQQQKAEIRLYMKQSNLAEFIHGEQLMKNGQLDESIIPTFVMKYDNKFSKRRAELNQPTIIINQPAPAPQPRNGINIRLGR
jgi:hypothetical protein